MRLDLFLKISRLIPRRSLAQRFCDSGQIFVNGMVARSAKNVKAGDLIEIRTREDIKVYRVESVPITKQISKGDAANITVLISQVRKEQILSP